MPSILASETDTYDQMWGMELYAMHSPGERYAPLFRSMVSDRRQGWGTVLDAGTGSGKGALALTRKPEELSGFLPENITLCDISDVGLVDEARAFPFYRLPLWANLRGVMGSFDWIYATDVMEHLPPEFTMLAIARMLEVARDGVFLSISTQPDQMGVWVDKTLHQTVRTFQWWRDHLAEFGKVREARDLLVNAVFLVEPF